MLKRDFMKRDAGRVEMCVFVRAQIRYVSCERSDTLAQGKEYRIQSGSDDALNEMKGEYSKTEKHALHIGRM